MGSDLLATRARMIGGCVDAQQAGRRLRAREIEQHHRRPVELRRPASRPRPRRDFSPAAQSHAALARRPKGSIELPVAGDGAGALALARHHQALTVVVAIAGSA